MLRKTICWAVLNTVALAQPQMPPVEAKRLPPDKAKALIDQYNFKAQMEALDAGPRRASEPVSAAAAPMPPTSAHVPAGYQPRSDLPLTPSAQAAAELSEQWRSGENLPAVERDGRVLYSFGAGLPTMVCAPLRVCMIELQTGEKLVGEPQIGDSVRWNLSPAMYGQGGNLTSVIVLKPQAPGLDTNLLITTDRRAYYLRLQSKPEDYVARLAFAYPNDTESDRKWQQHQAERNDKDRKAVTIPAPSTSPAELLNFRYRVRGDESMRPVRVFDDGSKTYIQIAPAVRTREAPVLVVIGPDKKPELVNYRVKDDTYIVDRLFEKAHLILGTGKKARKVEIDRERKG